MKASLAALLPLNTFISSSFFNDHLPSSPLVKESRRSLIASFPAAVFSHLPPSSGWSNKPSSRALLKPSPNNFMNSFWAAGVPLNFLPMSPSSGCSPVEVSVVSVPVGGCSAGLGF